MGHQSVATDGKDWYSIIKGWTLINSHQPSMLGLHIGLELATPELN